MEFTGKELIADVLNQLPEAQEILLSHGLSCVGCHINVYETLEQGCLGHGFSQELYQNVLKDLNDAATDRALQKDQPPSPPYLTKKAAEKVLEFQKLQEKEGFGLRVEVMEGNGPEPEYFLEFEEKPDRDDRVVTSRDIHMFVTPESHERLLNCEIDFFTNDEGQTGFKVEKVR